MELGIIGFFTFLNLMVLKLKFEQERFGDLTLDILTLVMLSYVFGGSIKGLEVAMIASALMSAFLYIFPPDFGGKKKTKKKRKSAYS